MFVIPFQVNETVYSIFICLEEDNIGRMKQYDPAEIVLANVGGTGRLKDVIVGYATAEDLATLTRMMNEGRPVTEALRFMSRGYAFRPEAGDTLRPDVPPISN